MQSIWGINLHPEWAEEEWIEFDSVINIRPRQGNPSRAVLDGDDPAPDHRHRQQAGDEMTYQHKGLAESGWNKLSLVEQMANVGAEVGRALNWREKKPDYALSSFYRSLELLSLTLANPENRGRLKEIARIKEVWADFFFGDNVYRSDAAFFERYFYAFGCAARLRRHAADSALPPTSPRATTG
ncbi:MAG: hypothetical protein HY321_20475 [Armatimonadetes bacterium]|nr:hypothetical protein [Armatimonadota bacterium]